MEEILDIYEKHDEHSGSIFRVREPLARFGEWCAKNGITGFALSNFNEKTGFLSFADELHAVHFRLSFYSPDAEQITTDAYRCDLVECLSGEIEDLRIAVKTAKEQDKIIRKLIEQGRNIADITIDEVCENHEVPVRWTFSRDKEENEYNKTLNAEASAGNRRVCAEYYPWTCEDIRELEERINNMEALRGTLTELVSATFMPNAAF